MSNQASDPLIPGRPTFHAHAVCVAERIDLKPFAATAGLARSPVMVRAGAAGRAVLFRYGVVVFFGLDPLEEAAFLKDLERFTADPYDESYSEETEVRIAPGAEEGVDNSGVILADTGADRLYLLAHMLAESVVLERYEKATAEGFERIEPIAVGLKQHGRPAHGARPLLRHIGDALLIEHKMVNRVAVGEKPDVLWDRSDLEPLYARLEKEYELRERRTALERKLELVSRTVETVLDLLNQKRNLRVEWYIVLLIVVEILLTLYEMFFRTFPTP